MKIYIAAKYHRRFELRFLANALKAHGNQITSRWLDNEEENHENGPAGAAQMDLDDVDSADVVLFVGEDQGSKNTGGGRWFELAYAYAAGKRCIAILGASSHTPHLGVAPHHETVFTSLPRIETCYSIDDAVRLLA
jgi:nucleoside 2-deoxyribosyltransferase